MNYLKSFNESNKDYKINDADFELIENCFLDYIEKNYTGEFIPLECVAREWETCVTINFTLPINKYEVIMDLVSKMAGIKSMQSFSKRFEDADNYLAYKWASGFLNQIAGDIKRCESYGFTCRFDRLRGTGTGHRHVLSNLYLIQLVVQNESTPEEQKIFSNLNLEDVYEDIQKKMQTIETRYNLN